MTAGHDLAMALRGAYLAMHRRSDACFARRGVTADQFVLLSALAACGGVTQRELARRASSDPNTVRAMLVLLQRRGLVARERHPTDGRAVSVALTTKGRRVYERLWADSEPVRDRLLAELRREEVTALIELLGRVAAAVAPGEGRLTTKRRE